MSEIIKGNARSSGYERAAHEWYCEPPRAVLALLDVERFIGPIHDPACGGGNIPTVAKERGYEATGADIEDRGYGEVRDFLSDRGLYANVICNPPFKLATQFTLRSLEQSSGKVAILQRLAWLEGRARFDHLFLPGYLHRIWAFSSRISMPPGGLDVPAQNGSVAYAWFVFEKTRRAAMAEIGWLP